MRRIAGHCAAGIALLACCSGCERPVEIPQQPAAESQVTSEAGCGDDTYVRTELFGSIERQIRWSSTGLRCESMLRPDGNGVRLRFIGDVAGRQLAIILALPELERGATAAESPTVVTLTVEGSGRFFSTASSESCWSDITGQEALGGDADRYSISGTLYCVSPLGEINGDAAISIPEMAFRGVIDWGAE